MPLITVCLPCYNQPAYLKICLDSILRQTFQDFEIQIWDDASETDYAPVLAQFAEARIRYRRNPRNVGALPNMFQALRGEYDSRYVIAFHEDDVMHPRLLELEIAQLEQSARLVFAASEMLTFQTPPVPAPPPVSAENYTRCEDVSDLVRLFLRGIPINFGSVLYRRAALAQHEPDRQRFAALCDRPFLCEIAKAGSAAILHAPLVLYRSHAGADFRAPNLSEDHLIALYVYYRSCLPKNWRNSDRALFYRNATNQLLDSYPRLSAAHKSNLRAFVAKCLRRGVFSPWHINRLGLRGIATALATPSPARGQVR